MAIQTINIGNYSNDGTGDDLRTAFEKVNANFSLLDTQDTTAASNLGSGQGVFAQKSGSTLQFKSLVAGSNITLAADGNTITITGVGNLQSEATPTLGGDLNLNGFNILGTGYGAGFSGDIKSTVWGIDIRTLVGAGANLDFGTFVAPGATDVDFGTF
jgi:hypothetical protein